MTTLRRARRSLHPLAQGAGEQLHSVAAGVSPTPPTQAPPTPASTERSCPVPDGPQVPDEHHRTSAAHRLATAGNSEAPACRSALPWSARLMQGWVGLGWVGWAKSLRQPSATARLLPAPESGAACAWSAMRSTPTTSTCAGRRQAAQPYSTTYAAMGAAGARANPAATRPPPRPLALGVPGGRSRFASSSGRPACRAGSSTRRAGTASPAGRSS
jgi:hypothetical protein